jgi:uncharacterized membrane protein YwzB
LILTPKVRKTLDIATRLSIATLSVSYIFSRIYSLPAGQVNTFIQSITKGNRVVFIVIGILGLMVVNWAIESLKWKLLIRQSERVSFGKAYQAVLGGLAVSVFTPNRVGEFLGRVFILKNTDPLKGITLTIVGSFSQLIVTIVFGTAAYLVFAPRYLSDFITDSLWLVNGFSLTLVTLSLVLVVAYFNISVLHRISILIPARYAEKIKTSIDAIALCPKQLLLKVIVLSMTRYLVFSTQFYLAIRLTGLNFTALQCMTVIPVIYLTLASIPTVALTELGVRGSVSVFLFGLLAGSSGLDASASLAVVSASTLIWLVNIALPSLAGVMVIFRLKFFRR